MNPANRRFRFLFATLFVAAATPALAAPGDDPGPTPAPGTWQRPAHSCGTPQIDRTGTFQPPPNQHAAGGQRTIFLNRNGGTYQISNGATNASTNVANRSVSANGQPRTAVIAPLAAGFNWPAIAACVRAQYAPYNVRIVETEPTSGTYIEAVVGGNGTELGYGADDLFGIASADNFCGVTEAGIAFNFSETHRNVPRKDDELCATIAHEVGHLLALEHETLAIDTMSYVLISESSTKAFVNQTVPCGVYPNQNQPCSCTSGTTNSAARLTSFVGLRPTETVPPSLTLVSPGNDTTLPPFFEVVATATDNMAMDSVAVKLNGFERGADFEPVGDEYRIMLSGIDEGQYTMIVEARDLAGNTATAEIAITIAKLATGDTCETSAQCRGDICATGDDGNFCTEACDPAAESCPDGFSCENAGALSVCAPVSDAGCCSTGQRPTGATGLLVFAVGLFLVRRRRRR